MTRELGWECPRCGAILAPWMPYCVNCKLGEGPGGPTAPRPDNTPKPNLEAALAAHIEARREMQRTGYPRRTR